MNTREHSVSIAALLALVACGGNIGSDSEAGGAGGGSASTGGAGGSTSGGTVGAAGGGGGSDAAAGLVGKWTGYVENYAFMDSTDTVAATIANPQLEGWVVFGQAPSPPPPTDPNIGYPPGFGPATALPQGPFVGFAHTTFAQSFVGHRLQFDVSPNELWVLWCEMQTPIPDETNPGMYGCVPNWGFESGPGGCFQTDPKSQQKVKVDCGKLMLCGMGSVCKCTATGCTADLGGLIHFDLDVTAPNADGSVSLSGVHNVHLKKQ